MVCMQAEQRLVLSQSLFGPRACLQTTILQTMGYDEWLAAVESDMPESDYDKTVQAEKNFLTMGRFN